MTGAYLRAAHLATVAEMVGVGASDRALADKITATAARLREAYDTLGADRLKAVLGTLLQTSLHAVLARLDTGRLDVSRMRRPELLRLLCGIAAGSKTFAEADTVQFGPIGAVRWSDLPLFGAGL